MEKSCSTSYLLRWLPFIAWGVIVLWMSLIPHPPTIDNSLLGWDKFEHAAAYSLMAALAGWAFGCLSFSFRQRWFLAAGAAIAIGAVLEVLQGALTRTRTAEFGDLFADFLGAAVVYVTAILFEKLLQDSRRG